MDDPGTLHVIEDDLSEDWLVDLLGAGVAAIDEYLAKHLAFLSFLDDDAATQRR